MPHEVWNLGNLTASQRLQPRQFIAGIEPGKGVVIGRRREPKRMLVILDAWIEVIDWDTPVGDDFVQAKYSLAIGKDPLNTALLLPVGRVWAESIAAAGVNAVVPGVEQLFKAHGWKGAAKQVAVDFVEAGALNASDVDLHMDWTVADVDWWTWFISWNNLEAAPDGNLVDGERAYA